MFSVYVFFDFFNFFQFYHLTQLNLYKKMKVVAASLASWGVWPREERVEPRQLEAQSCPETQDKLRACMRGHEGGSGLCVQGQSDCVLKEGKLRQCLKEGNCKALKYSFFECKRSMLDARSRFRGSKRYWYYHAGNQDENNKGLVINPEKPK